jgi:hypothetical protein
MAMRNVAITRRDLRGIACIAAMATAAGACSTTATISRRHGPAYEAEIVGSDADTLRLENGDGQALLVPREDVVDIDHPGNVLMTIGAVILGVGTINVLGTYGQLIEPMSGQSQNQAAAAATVVAIIPGAILTVVGAIIYGRSRNRAAAFQSPAARTRSLAPGGLSLQPQLLQPAPDHPVGPTQESLP